MILNNAIFISLLFYKEPLTSTEPSCIYLRIFGNQKWLFYYMSLLQRMPYNWMIGYLQTNWKNRTDNLRSDCYATLPSYDVHLVLHNDLNFKHNVLHSTVCRTFSPKIMYNCSIHGNNIYTFTWNYYFE